MVQPRRRRTRPGHVRAAALCVGKAMRVHPPRRMPGATAEAPRAGQFATPAQGRTGETDARTVRAAGRNSGVALGRFSSEIC